MKSNVRFSLTHRSCFHESETSVGQSRELLNDTENDIRVLLDLCILEFFFLLTLLFSMNFNLSIMSDLRNDSPSLELQPLINDDEDNTDIKMGLQNVDFPTGHANHLKHPKIQLLRQLIQKYSSEYHSAARKTENRLYQGRRMRCREAIISRVVALLTRRGDGGCFKKRQRNGKWTVVDGNYEAKLRKRISNDFRKYHTAQRVSEFANNAALDHPPSNDPHFDEPPPDEEPSAHDPSAHQKNPYVQDPSILDPPSDDPDNDNKDSESASPPDANEDASTSSSPSTLHANDSSGVNPTIDDKLKRGTSHDSRNCVHFLSVMPLEGPNHEYFCKLIGRNQSVVESPNVQMATDTIVTPTLHDQTYLFCTCHCSRPNVAVPTPYKGKIMIPEIAKIGIPSIPTKDRITHNNLTRDFDLTAVNSERNLPIMAMVDGDASSDTSATDSSLTDLDIQDLTKRIIIDEVQASHSGRCTSHPPSPLCWLSFGTMAIIAGLWTIALSPPSDFSNNSTSLTAVNTSRRRLSSTSEPGENLRGKDFEVIDNGDDWTQSPPVSPHLLSTPPSIPSPMTAYSDSASLFWQPSRKETTTIAPTFNSWPVLVGPSRPPTDDIAKAISPVPKNIFSSSLALFAINVTYSGLAMPCDDKNVFIPMEMERIFVSFNFHEPNLTEFSEVSSNPEGLWKNLGVIVETEFEGANIEVDFFADSNSLKDNTGSLSSLAGSSGATGNLSWIILDSTVHFSFENHHWQDADDIIFDENENSALERDGGKEETYHILMEIGPDLFSSFGDIITITPFWGWDLPFVAGATTCGNHLPDDSGWLQSCQLRLRSCHVEL